MMKNDWNSHIASIWAEVLAGKLHNGDRILEVAPGGTNKIGLALASVNFRGTLYVVEPEALALADTMKAYSRILPDCKIVPVATELSKFSGEFDVLLSNHPLDDMIVGGMLTPDVFASFFHDHYEKPVDATKALWAQSSGRIQSSIRKTVNEMASRMSSARLSIVSQYSSYFFTSNQFTKPDDIAFDALKEIRNAVQGHLFRDSRWLIA